ncbi:angiotensin-converting enzyme-like [Ptychodera flava]|uniref:angiotensin-converting enzyme-like n=1 Tax=Ptychodera flava TaxID=63121 RepID=UPI00396A0F8B
MARSFSLVLLALMATLSACQTLDCEQPEGSNTDEAEAIDWLNNTYNPEAQDVFYASVSASWDYNTDINEENLAKMLEESANAGEFRKDSRQCALVFDRSDFSFDTQRRLDKLAYIGTSALEEEKFNEFNTLVADMETIYSTGTVCDRPGDEDPDKCYVLDPDLYALMANSRDYNELVWAWEGWRDACGPEIKTMYPRYVELSNEAAQLNDQPDMGAYWRSWYETEDFEEQVMRLWSEVQPLYQQLHAYVRRKLSEVYGEKYVSLYGAIPAHLLGNMWAQDWMSISDLVLPYPDKSSIDVTDELIRQGYTVLDMFELSENFFVSLGLIESPETFWNDSMFEKPDDGRDVICHASAWDFYNRRDFRIKQCTVITHDDLIVVHHEMGHTQYFFQYAPHPVEYRDGANPGFHEAVGDVIALSVQTPEHLHKVGLLPDYEEDDESDLNFLMEMGLQKIAFLPFGLLVDLYRWEIFAGNTTEYNYNERWWHLRTAIQGVVPPVRRSDMKGDFDAGAKFHIPADVPYIRYFISHILQFQFHEALCIEAGQFDPNDPDSKLHRCDIHESLEAGKLLGDMLKLGSSLPWPEAMEAITGQRDMSAEPLMEFFEPLIDWLKAENEKNGDIIGWDLNWRPPEDHWTEPPTPETPVEPEPQDPVAGANRNSDVAVLSLGIGVLIAAFTFRV